MFPSERRGGSLRAWPAPPGGPGGAHRRRARHARDDVRLAWAADGHEVLRHLVARAAGGEAPRRPAAGGGRGRAGPAFRADARTADERLGPARGERRPGPRGRRGPRARRGAAEAGQRRRLVAAQRVSSLRLESCSLRSTLEAWDSTVFTEMNRREPISR